MEALAAVSLTGNILQFLDFCGKVVSGSREIYHSFSGTTKEYESLEQVYECISEISAGLVPPLSPEALRKLPPEQRPTEMEIRLAWLAMRCKEASDRLLKDLKASRVESRASRRMAASLLLSIKNALGRSRLKLLEKEVQECRNNLMYCLESMTIQKSSSLVKYVEALQRTQLNLVHDHSGKAQQMTELLHDIHLGALKFLENNELKQEQTDPHILLAVVSEQVRKLGATSGRHYAAEHAIVESLFYDSLSARRESIPEAHKDTFYWLLDKTSSKKRRARHPEIRLLEWLRAGDGIYWVSGKPGSGKSTLMKFVSDHPVVQTALNEWAGGPEQCMVGAYYFWSAGTPLQKSVEGLLRSLLFDIFVRHPSLISVALPDRWETLSGRRTDDASHLLVGVAGRAAKQWTISELSQALERLSLHKDATQHFCFFIDGLDEFHGDHHHLVKVLKTLSGHPNIKLCVSSRPWNVFEDEWGSQASKKLSLHELTRLDIRRYISSTLRESPQWKTEADSNPSYKRLIHDITERAQGVFLWVILVVQSVLEGLGNGDSIILLERRMKELPEDLGTFFRHMLTSVSPIYRKRMALYFQILIHAPHTLTLMHFSFLDECLEMNGRAVLAAPIAPMDDHDIFSRHAVMRRRLNARCKGLVEAHLIPAETRSYLSRQVTFLHRTVRDFLRTDEMTRFLAEFLADYALNTAMLMAYISLIKSLPSPAAARAQLQDALVYAARAEDESPETVVACVDELHDTMTRLALMDAQSSEMVRWVVQSGLCRYVRQSIHDGAPGFDDPSRLIEFALTAAADPESRADMLPMVSTILDAADAHGSRLTAAVLSRYLRAVGTNVQRWQEPDLALRQKKMIQFVLGSAGMSSDFATPDLAGACQALFTSLILDEWELMPPSVVDARVEIILALFAHGRADPNSLYAPADGAEVVDSTAVVAGSECSTDTVWTWFCAQLRKREGAMQNGGVSAEALARCTEVLVQAGAELGHNGSLQSSELSIMFPQRAAGRIGDVMAKRRQDVQHADPSGRNRFTSWASWAVSWLWSGSLG
ncbi:hypothetical protein B0T16DRAFT_246926 [Cercophora newfieldiana]|uniref:NACHT domain-containing protein n=1 Tax=Cercophora newfieldiana TaxID=92897 RepID=A0AA39XTR7_9PEZI|nr:hypothetical protein B0T16DRAFT_246926 [Cercophora newfieldiana]